MAENWNIVIAQLRSEKAALIAQLRECTETLGADQIDDMRASRAYADSMALLDEMTHIRGMHSQNDSLMEHS